MMRTSVILLFLILASFQGGGRSQRARAPPYPLSPRDPPRSVNKFFASCLKFGSRSQVDWRAITDFNILHTSWFQNSDVGECASNNPNVTTEANCWKTAFRSLMSSGSQESYVAEVCVDRFVAFSKGSRTKRSTSSVIPFIRGPSMDHPECPPVDANQFASQVIDAMKSSTSRGGLRRLFSVLKGFGSVIEYVKKVALCVEPTCDLCNTNYRSTEDPKRELKCNECWPTRLAGMIKNSSLLKEPVTRTAVNLGNNLPTRLPQVPPSFVNSFFASCISNITTNHVNWRSITDFLIIHTSWYANSDVGSCSPSNPDVIDEANCWKSAFNHVISHRSPLSVIVDLCVDLFVAQTRPMIRNISKRRVEPPRMSSTETNVYSTTGASLDNQDCPPVDPELFKTLFLQAISTSSSPEDFLPYDTVLEDVSSVIQFVMEQASCTEPTCDECDIQYSNPFLPNQKLNCNECWPTRLAGMIKSSSPLKNASVAAAVAVENSGLLPTKLVCGSKHIDISLGRDDYLNLRLSGNEELIMWGSSINDVTSIDQSCRSSRRTQFSFPSTSCQPFVEVKNSMMHFTYTMRKVLPSSFRLATDTYVDSTMNITCSYELSQDVSASSTLFPVVRKISLPERRSVGDFDIALGFFDNRFVTRLPRNSTSFIATNVFLAGHIDVVADDVTLQALHCWASRSRVDRLTTRLDLVRNGCPTHNTVYGLPNPILENGISSTVRFKFRRGIFKRFGRAPIYAHCLMRICDKKHEDCEFHCNNPSIRKKRGIKNRDEGKLITTGPLMQRTKTASCGMDGKTCTDLCKVHDGGILCSCHPGRTLYSDGKMCLDNTFLEEHNASSFWPPWYLICISMFGGVMLLFILVLVVHKNKTK